MHEVLTCQSSLLVLAPLSAQGFGLPSGGRAPWAESSDHHRRVTPGAGVVRMVKFATPHGRARLALGLRGSLERRRSVSIDTRVVSSTSYGVLGTRTWRPYLSFTLLRRCGRVKRMAVNRRADPAVCAAASARRQLRPPKGGWQAPWRLCVPVTPRGHPGAGFLARAGTRHARSAPAYSLGAASTQWNNVRARLDRSLAGLSAGHKLSGVFFVQTVVSA